jgi:hypothetical protein
MYIRTTQRHNRDGSTVRYLQLAESVWDPDNQRSQTRIVYNSAARKTSISRP